MTEASKLRFWHAVALVACVGVLWVHLDDFGASEFSGGWLTGKLFAMADIGALVFLAALVLAFFLPRVAAIIGLVATLFCLPFYLYIVMPGLYRAIFRGEYSVQLVRPFVWNSWAIAGIITLIFAVAFSIRRLYNQSPDKSAARLYTGLVPHTSGKRVTLDFHVRRQKT